MEWLQLIHILHPPLSATLSMATFSAKEIDSFGG